MVTKSATVNERGAIAVDRVLEAIRFEIAEGGAVFGQGGKLKQHHALVWPRVNWAIDGRAVTGRPMTDPEAL